MLATAAFLLAEQPFVGGKLTGFLRAGLSDGDNTRFAGGWQAGLLAISPVPGRPESQFSIGVHQAFLSDKFRANAADAGDSLRATEMAVEVTYADKLANWLTVQPDLAYVWNPSRRNALVLTLRLRAGLSRP